MCKKLRYGIVWWWGIILMVGLFKKAKKKKGWSVFDQQI